MIPTMAKDSRLRKMLGHGMRTGLGGEGVLRTEGRGAEALAVLEAAFRNGIRYYDSAPAYAGSERYQGHFWAEHPDRREETFQAGKSAERDAAHAEADLARTLSRTGRDHLGLWQVHDIRSRDDIRRLEGPGGALRAFLAARETGTAHGIGVTGHHDPAILLHAVTSWDVDAVLLPVNPVEAAIGGFLDRVVPAARERGIGVIGMKVLGAGQYLFPEKGLSAESLIRFALAQDVDMVIVGCSMPKEAELLARIGKEDTPMDEEEQAHMIETVRSEGKRMAFYRGVI
jgi:aryl-alcohol dehydrogenase-like predicted oxidoreductase